MSGICGLFNIDGAPVAEAKLRAMNAMLEKRGPDRSGTWHEQQFGLGHTLLATTPQLSAESHPFVDTASGCVITADVRLDNREDLIRLLGIDARDRSLGDGQLILNAYLRWGTECPDRLIGDFAFAIVDTRQQRVFCARDHSGMRQLYYHFKAAQRFVFANDARAICVLPEVPYAIDQGRVADFLVEELEWVDYTSSFYEGIFRLPPGHKIVVNADGIQIEEYWRPRPPSSSVALSDDDCIEGFREVLTEAVRCRLQGTPGSVGSMLSGGMDSGSVVAIAKEILNTSQGGPLPTFSGVQRRAADCAESRAIYSAITIDLIEPTLIHPDSLGAIYKSLTSNVEEPFDGAFMILKAIYLTAQKNGQKVILDGGGGDVVLGEGSYIVRLMRAGKLRHAFAEIAGANKFWTGTTMAQDLAKYARAAFIPEAVKSKLRPFVRRSGSRDYIRDSLISREFAEAVHIEDRLTRLTDMYPTGWTPDYATERCDTIRPNVTGGRERYARLAAGAGVEASDPFLDKRVIEFCAQLPGRARHRDGWPKIILRDLMSDKLPDDVRWARGKPHIGWTFNEAVTRQALQQGDLSLDRLQGELRDYVDLQGLEAAWEQFVRGGDAEAIHSVHILANWLRETVNRPIVSAEMIG